MGKPTKARVVNLSLTLTPPMAGETAHFALKKPDSSMTTKTLLTDQDGVAVAQFSLGPKYRSGTYRGRVDLVIKDQQVYAENSVEV